MKQQGEGTGKKKNKTDKGGSKLDREMEQCEVFMHPSSVNGKKEVVSFGDAGFMVFLEQMETTKVYIRDCTAITAYPLLLFGGSLQVKVVGGFGMGDSNAEVSVGEGGWIKFRTTRVIASLIEKIREAMEGLLQEKIANPCASHWLKMLCPFQHTWPACKQLHCNQMKLCPRVQSRPHVCSAL